MRKWHMFRTCKGQRGGILQSLRHSNTRPVRLPRREIWSARTSDSLHARRGQEETGAALLWPWLWVERRKVVDRGCSKELREQGVCQAAALHEAPCRFAHLYLCLLYAD